MDQKYSGATCTLDHTGDLPQELLNSLPMNQGSPVRHRCAACAYLAGLNESAEDVKKLVSEVRELREEIEKLRAGLTARGV